MPVPNKPAPTQTGVTRSDQDLAHPLKAGRGGVWHLIFLVLVVLCVVSGFVALGTLMSVGLMMLPAIAARHWSASLGGQVRTAVLVDRNHKNFPVTTDFAGIALSTVIKERVDVFLTENGKEDAVYLT